MNQSSKSENLIYSQVNFNHLTTWGKKNNTYFETIFSFLKRHFKVEGVMLLSSIFCTFYSVLALL